MKNRCFSLEEANALLPQLEVILIRLLTKKESHERLHDHLFMHELLHEATNHSRSKEEESQKLEEGALHVDGQVLDLEEDLKQIRTLGCFLRSLERGWVEFPAEHQGQPVYWCWKKGEREVRFYRPLSTTALERFPL